MHLASAQWAGAATQAACSNKGVAWSVSPMQLPGQTSSQVLQGKQVRKLAGRELRRAARAGSGLPTLPCPVGTSTSPAQPGLRFLQPGLWLPRSTGSGPASSRRIKCSEMDRTQQGSTRWHLGTSAGLICPGHPPLEAAMLELHTHALMARAGAPGEQQEPRGVPGPWVPFHSEATGLKRASAKCQGGRT